jgi:hypothetical protein
MPGLAEWRDYHEAGTEPPGWAQLLKELGMSND